MRFYQTIYNRYISSQIDQVMSQKVKSMLYTEKQKDNLFKTSIVTFYVQPIFLVLYIFVGFWSNFNIKLGTLRYLEIYLKKVNDTICHIITMITLRHLFMES